MKKILICGATGFIGKNVTLELSKNKNYEIHAVRFKRPKYSTTNNVIWHKADLRNANSVNKLTKDIDIVIQLAATTSGSKDIVSMPYVHVTDNAVMNSYILRSCFDNNVKHFMFTSCTVMYPSSKKSTKESNFTGEIIEKYKGVGETKVYIEKIAKFFSTLGKTKHTIIRHSNIYGPHDKYDLNKSHVFGATITKVMTAKKEVVVWGKGTEERDLLHIDDLVNFVKLVIRKQKKRFELLNCGAGYSISIDNLVKKIIRISNKKLKIKYDLSKPTIPTYLSVNCDLAKKKLGWKPKIKLEDGIKSTIGWWKKNI